MVVVKFCKLDVAGTAAAGGRSLCDVIARYDAHNSKMRSIVVRQSQLE